MRKIFLSTLAAIIAAQSVVAASATQYTVSYDAVTEEISIEGVSTPRSKISLEVLFPGRTGEEIKTVDTEDFVDIIYRVDQTNSDSEGRFGFVFMMDNMPTGEYLTIVNGEIGDYIYYVSNTEVSELINGINKAADENDIRRALTENITVFGEMGKYFEKLKYEEQIEIAKEILKERGKMSNEIFSKLEQLTSVFYERTLIAAMCDDSGNIDKKSLLEEGEGILKLDELSAYVYYSDFSDSEKKFVADNTGALKPKTVDEIKVAFTEQTILSQIALTRAEQLKALLEKYKDIFNIDYSDYNKLSSYRQLQVLQKLAEKRYTSAEQFKKSFVEAVEDVKASEASGSGSSGSGSSGSSIRINSAAVNVNNITEEPVRTQKVFSDLSGYEWAEDSIISLYNKGIINGQGDGRFCPGDNVKREEFVKILVEALEVEEDGASGVFSDVDETMWYAPYVNKAYAAGWINGISRDKFGVGDNITRQDMAVILYRIAKLNKVELPQNKSIVFADEYMISDYAKEAVSTLAGAGIINGNPDGSFSAQNNATRAETIMLVNAFLEIL